MTSTAQLADLVLPAATCLEQDEVVSMNEIWCVLARRKEAQVEKAGDSDVIAEPAHRLGVNEAFPYWQDAVS